jgi:hypothetical protein
VPGSPALAILSFSRVGALVRGRRLRPFSSPHVSHGIPEFSEKPLRFGSEGLGVARPIRINNLERDR